MSTKPLSRLSGRRPPIFRVKTGCFTCRSRKKKCDEVKPVCAGCKRNKLNCRWPTSAQTARRAQLPPLPTKPFPEREHIRIAPATTTQDTIVCAPTPRPNPDAALDPSAESYIHVSTSLQTGSPGTPPSPASSASNLPPDPVPSATSPIALHDSIDTTESGNESLYELDNEFFNVDGIIEPLDSIQECSAIAQFGMDSVPRSVFPFPNQTGPSLDLLSHYLSRTALSMGNGSISVNPFISQLIPLSFANNLILDLVLCQSAAHRAVEDNTKLEVANRHYNKAVRQFRKSIQDYVDGQETSPLWIVVGALIMCFTETAKGDPHGIIFDHIKGAGPLLSTLLSDPGATNNDLMDFVIEYYIYTATISMISVNPSASQTPFLNPDLERHGERLVRLGYIGQLCGCWLELLLLLPKIFRFGQGLRDSNAEPKFPTADDFVVFSTLQMQVLSFQPLSLLGSDVTLCGEIFKQAIHLYLLTSLSGSGERDGPFRLSIESTVNQAFEYLRGLPSTSRINTSLCWALGVIGSCVSDEDRRNELRSRLDIMFLMIGLGNIRATSVLLEHVWALPVAEQSPWIIWKVMRDNQVWISFA